jgi:hypothetical protein
MQTELLSEVDQVREELEAIRSHHGGILRAEDVVEFARDETTALHRQFEWDDTEAAHQYRLEQARRVIRLRVTVTENLGSDRPIPMYVSLSSDRVIPGGGYRPFVDVMSDEQMRAELLRQAMEEFKRVARKYHALEELSPVFAAIERLAAR